MAPFEKAAQTKLGKTTGVHFCRNRRNGVRRYVGAIHANATKGDEVVEK